MATVSTVLGGSTVSAEDPLMMGGGIQGEDQDPIYPHREDNDTEDLLEERMVLGGGGGGGSKGKEAKVKVQVYNVRGASEIWGTRKSAEIQMQMQEEAEEDVEGAEGKYGARKALLRYLRKVFLRQKKVEEWEEEEVEEWKTEQKRASRKTAAMYWEMLQGNMMLKHLLCSSYLTSSLQCVLENAYLTENCLVDSWVGSGRVAFLDLSAGPCEWGPIVGGEGVSV